MSKIKPKIKFVPLLSLSLGLAALSLLATQQVLASEINVAKVVKLTNEARIKEGVGELVENDKLDQAAEDKAQDMLKNDYFAHFSPRGVSPWHWFDKNDYDYHFAGENLAINFTDAESQQKAWMDSPTHRKNILNSNYAEIGVAVERGTINNQEATITVQMFGLPAGQPVPSGPVKETESQGKVLASSTQDSFSSEANQNIWQPWIIIGLILMGAIAVDFILINRQQHHRTLVIVHHR